MRIPEIRLNLNSAQKILITLFACITVAVIGAAYQYSYNQRKIEYTEAITGYYRKYFNREPDASGLRHWVTWALNKWPLEKVERVGFKEVLEREGPR